MFGCIIRCILCILAHSSVVIKSACVSRQCKQKQASRARSKKEEGGKFINQIHATRCLAFFCGHQTPMCFQTEQAKAEQAKQEARRRKEDKANNQIRATRCLLGCLLAPETPQQPGGPTLNLLSEIYIATEIYIACKKCPQAQGETKQSAGHRSHQRRQSVRHPPGASRIGDRRSA